MSEKVIDGYRLIGLLGTGGMATVYLAQRADPGPSGDLLALKLLHPHLCTARNFSRRFLREAELGMRIHHPNVVRTLDAGQVRMDGERRFYLVMEYVEGQTLRELVEETGPVGERLCRHIGVEVARALTEIHRTEVIHRDIKPENILITKDESVRVMDLGAAVLKDQAIRLSHTGAFGGTLHYAAPEQIREGGRNIDGRADLYSLGLILYELATGAHPFPTQDLAEIIRRQLYERPAPPSTRNRRISPCFEALILKLLEKDREWRFPDAASVLGALESGEESSWWEEVRSSAGDPGRPRRAALTPRETRLVGRHREMAIVGDRWNRARCGQGQVVLIEGEPGIGKTRLLEEIAIQIGEGPDAANLVLCAPPPGAQASRSFSAAYREFLDERSDGVDLAGLLDNDPGIVAAFGAFLRGEPIPADSGLREEAIPALFTRLNRAASRLRPTLLMIDDLHAVPEEGRALFLAMAHAHVGDRVLLIGTAGTGSLPGEFLRSLRSLSGFCHLVPTRLGPEDVGAILEEALRPTPAARELAPRLAERTDGIPWFVFEALATMKDQEILHQRQDGGWEIMQTPSRIEIPRSRSVAELQRARMEKLGDDDRGLLELASCYGFEFDPILLAEALGLGRIPVLKRLGNLERHHRVVHSRGRLFRFDHHLVQTGLYEALPPPLREEYHAALGAALEERERSAGRDPMSAEGETAVEIATHLLRGGRTEAGGPWLEPALRHLRAGFWHERALDLAELALALPGFLTGVARAKCLRTEADAQRSLGRLPGLEDALREALDLAEEAGDRDLWVDLSHRLARQLWETGRMEEAISRLEDAAGRLPENGDPVTRGRILTQLGHIHAQAGRYSEANACYERHLETARRAGDRAGEAEAIGNLGLTAYERGRLEEARELLERCLELDRDTGNLEREGIATGNLGLVNLDLGDFAEARRCLERQLAISRKIGYRRGEANALGNLGLVREAEGHLSKALESFENDLRIRREMRDPWHEGIALGLIGDIQLVLGDHEASRRNLTAALKRFEETGAQWGPATVQHRLGRLLREEGRDEEAEEYFGRAESTARATGTSTTLSQVLLSRGILHLERGERDEAVARLRGAWKVAEDTGDKDAAVLSRAHLCRSGAEEPEAVRKQLSEEAARISRYATMEAHFALFLATGEPEDLAAAHRVLSFLTEHVRGPDRKRFREKVSLHRRILMARPGATAPGGRPADDATGTDTGIRSDATGEPQ